jgi:hypothetical protein
VLTRPDPETDVLGLNYRDHDDGPDGRDNEDMYKFTPATGELTPYMRGTFEREYPEYTGHHWAAKDFLRKPPQS